MFIRKSHTFVEYAPDSEQGATEDRPTGGDWIVNSEDQETVRLIVGAELRDVHTGIVKNTERIGLLRELVEVKLETVDAKLGAIEERFGTMNERFASVDRQLSGINEKLNRMIADRKWVIAQFIMVAGILMTLLVSLHVL